MTVVIKPFYRTILNIYKQISKRGVIYQTIKKIALQSTSHGAICTSTSGKIMMPVASWEKVA